MQQGYRRTQMADVAERLGVAKGTLYLYVEGKEALFDAVLARADSVGQLALPSDLPLANPRPGVTLRKVKERVSQGSAVKQLSEALTRTRVTEARAELEGIVRE